MSEMASVLEELEGKEALLRTWEAQKRFDDPKYVAQLQEQVYRLRKMLGWRQLTRVKGE